MNTAALKGAPARDPLEGLPSRRPAPHTHVHHVLRRLLEIAQDVVVMAAIVTTVNELILIGHDGPPQAYLAIAALLAVLGGLLALDRWQAHLRDDVNHTSAH